MAAQAIQAGVNTGAAIISGWLGARAARRAARAQELAAQEARDVATQTTRDAAGGVSQATGTAQDWMLDAARNAAGQVTAAGEQGRDAVAGEYATGLERLNPYLEAGRSGMVSLRDMLAPGGDLNRRFSMADYQEDPGLAFRTQQGEQAIQRAAAARGNVMGGSTLKAMMRFNSGLGAQEYQNAFDRFQQENQARTARLFNLAGIGERSTTEANRLGQWAGGTTLQSLLDSARLAGDYSYRGAADAGETGLRGAGMGAEIQMRGADAVIQAILDQANARAAGIIGRGNAYRDMTRGIANAGSPFSGFGGGPAPVAGTNVGPITDSRWSVPPRPRLGG